MKTSKILTAIAGVALFAACTEMELTTPALEVSVDTGNAVTTDETGIPVFAKGDIVKFNLNTDADMLTFYSGEPGMMFRHRNRTSIDGLPCMQFDISHEGSGEPEYLNLLLSSDFKGFVKDAAIDAQSILDATWEDITGQANIPTVKNTTGSSQKIDLSDYAGKPLYIAFRYTRPFNPPGGGWLNFRILNFYVNNEADGFVYPVVNAFTAQWTAFDFNAPQGGDPYITAVSSNQGIWDLRNAERENRISIGYGTTVDNDDWLISTAIDLTSIPPDMGEGIKKYNDDNINQYNYIFKATGTFTVSFLAVNSRYSDTKTRVEEVKIKIVEN
jgi:hypothetical protein